MPPRSPVHKPARELHPHEWASSSSPARRSGAPLMHHLSWQRLAVVLLVILFSVLVNNSRRRQGSGQQQQQQQQQDESAACVSQDQPNPLAELFPYNATGMLNATLVVVPVPLAVARRLIPSQYGILEHAYRSLLPDFPDGMYPVLVQAAHDHDVQLRAYGLKIDDFSRVGFEFPFLDLLGDGYSSFRWAPAQLLTAGRTVAIEGSRAYGTVVSPARFDPPCDAYRAVPGEGGASTYMFRGSGVPEVLRSAREQQQFLELEMTRLSVATSNPYPLAFYANATNQPIFGGDGGVVSSCDNMVRWFNTSLSEGVFAPAWVSGTLRARDMLPFARSVGGDNDDEDVWTGVFGVQVATPFVENNYVDCSDLQGYSGTGWEGDRSGVLKLLAAGGGGGGGVKGVGHGGL